MVEVKEAQDEAVRPICPYLEQVNGDLYALIGAVSSTLEMAGQLNRAKEFVGRSMMADTYDALLEVSREFVQFDGERSDKREASSVS